MSPGLVKVVAVACIVCLVIHYIVPILIIGGCVWYAGGFVKASR
jgi:hypothetical protein